MAEKDNQGTQAYKFWNSKKWRKVYGYQIVLANRLSKQYSCAAIVKAINSKELKHMYSLGYPGIHEIIQKYQNIIESQKPTETNIIIQDQPKTRSASFGKKSQLQRLRNVDGKEKKG
jgi:hypothetical protein